MLCLPSSFSRVRLVKNRLAKFRNSNSSNSFFSASTSGSVTLNSSSSNSTGASNIMVANSFERSAWSAKFSTFSFCFPFSLSVFLSRFSTDSNSAIKSLALFSPIPGTPGILSEASPHKPNISMSCSGR